MVSTSELTRAVSSALRDARAPASAELRAQLRRLASDPVCPEHVAQAIAERYPALAQEILHPPQTPRAVTEWADEAGRYTAQGTGVSALRWMYDPKKQPFIEVYRGIKAEPGAAYDLSHGGDHRGLLFFDTDPRVPLAYAREAPTLQREGQLGRFLLPTVRVYQVNGYPVVIHGELPDLAPFALGTAALNKPLPRPSQAAHPVQSALGYLAGTDLRVFDELKDGQKRVVVEVNAGTERIAQNAVSRLPAQVRGGAEIVVRSRS